MTSSVFEKLSEHGIRLRHNRYGDQKMLCPKCNGGKGKEHSLSVTVDADEAVWLCHRAHCGWRGGVRTGEHRDDYQPRRKFRPDPVRPTYTPKVETVNDSVVKWFSARGISKATLDRNHISVTKAWMPGPNVEVNCIAFPYFRDGELVNVKYRDSDKHFRQEKGAEKILFGMDNVPQDAESLIWVEGECDVLALNETGIWNAVSVPDGAPSQFKWDNADRACDVHKHIVDPTVKVCPGCGAHRVEEVDAEDDAKFEYVWNCREFIDRFKRHILAVDMDAPGRVLEDELARRIGKERCWRVQWPDAAGDVSCKDANDTLKECGAEAVREAIKRATGYPLQGLHEVESFRDETMALYRGGRKKGLSTGFTNVDRLYTVRPGELCVVTGYPSSGKSEFVDAVAVNMAIMHGWTFAVCSFENPPDEHIGKWAAKCLGIPFNEGPTPRMTEHELGRAMDWMQDKLILLRAGEGSATIDWVLEKARLAVMRYGIKGLILDPYNEFEHIRPNGMTETEYVSQMLAKIKRFAQNYDVHVWFVAHPAKPPKDRQDEAPTLYDISGSANWVNKADVGIAVHRQFLADGSRDSVADVHVRKVRFRAVGQPGIARLEFLPATERYIEVD